jgi:hypothetical protein
MRAHLIVTCCLLPTMLAASCYPKGSTIKDDTSWTPVDTEGDTDTDTDADTDTGDCLPQIAASPETLDFGVVSHGFYASGIVEVRSVGCAVLAVSGFSLTGDDFELLTHSAAHTLAPGESFTVSVGYQTYESGPDLGELTVSSDDPDGALVVPLVGEGS